MVNWKNKEGTKPLFTIDEGKLVKLFQEKLKNLGTSQSGKYDGSMEQTWEKTDTVMYIIGGIAEINIIDTPIKVLISMFNTGWILKFEFSVVTENEIKPYSAMWDLIPKRWHKISDPAFFTIIESLFLEGKREDELSENWVGDTGDEFTEDVKTKLRKLGCYEYAD